MKEFAIDTCRKAGAVLLSYFGKVTHVNSKGDISNVVTEADLATEALVIAAINKHYPTHGTVGEETGYTPGTSEFTWIIDPLDGTSNFVAGIPWFGVLLALCKGTQPILGAMYLPVSEEIYFAESGKGAFRNGERIKVTDETELRNVLCGYGMDTTANAAQTEKEVRLLSTLKNSVRNIRTTNSLVDACFTADGRLGGFMNQQMKIWDIAASQVVVQEAGGRVTDLEGQPLRYEFDALQKNYPVIVAASSLHQQMVELTKSL